MMDDVSEKRAVEQFKGKKAENFYYIQQRKDSPWKTVSSLLPELPRDTVVMVETDHGLEPAKVMGLAPVSHSDYSHVPLPWTITAIAGDDEICEFETLEDWEKDAFKICSKLVAKHQLNMKLVRVERFFNGSKIIFYFTAENRVDFRGLVKDLVQEYRTRIEMRQIGVRHETKMIGGLGICGREFCCSQHLENFSSVSIKMAKEQDLPLNPNKISGVCNRLFCCLTHEYETYKKERRAMPRPGKRIALDGEEFTVVRQNVLKREVVVHNSAGEELSLNANRWGKAQPVKGKVEKGQKDSVKEDK